MKFEAFLDREKRRGATSLPLPRRKLHDGQLRAKAGAGRWNAIACGRRWGKTYFGIDLAYEKLAEGLPVAWSAPEYKLLTEVFDTIRRDLEPWVTRAHQQERVIELSNGGKIEFWTLTDPDVGRSRKYSRWIADEAAMTPNFKQIWNAAIRPTLTDLRGDGWLLSTPKGQSGFFWEKFCNIKDSDDAPDWYGFTAPTASNSTIPDVEAEVEEARLSMPYSVFAQEYLAEFTKPAGAVFDCFDPAVHLVDTLAPRGQAMVGWDFGSANTAFVVAYDMEEDGKRFLYVDCEYHASGDDPGVHVQRCLAKCNSEYKWAAGGAGNEDSTREAYFKAGMRVRKPRISGPDSYELGVQVVYSLLKQNKIKFSRNCSRLINEIQSMVYQLDGDDKILDKVADRQTFHVFDALRYLCVTWGDAPVKFKKLAGRF